MARYTPHGKRAIQGKQVSYTGMRDSKDPTTADPRKASLLRNVYPVLSEYLGGVRGRPGYEQLGSQLGGGGRVQLLKQFSKLDGTEYTIAIVGGKFYTLNWGTESWTEVLTATDFTNASITLSSTAPVFAVTFADQIVFTDGVNTPWTWDGTTNGGLTKLTNAPVAYGQPTVYYGKLFFIKDSERSTIVWSEENQPNTGYEAGGFNNAWTLGQTDQEALYIIRGTNNALFYWRARSMGAITGAVTPDFKTTGTHDAISQTVGSISPGGVVFYQNTFFFFDADGHPQMFTVGRGFRNPPVWFDVRETLDQLNFSHFDNMRGVYLPDEHLVMLTYTALGDSENDSAIMIHPETGDIQGKWDFADKMVSVVIAKGDNGDLVKLSGTDDGYIHKHGSPNGNLWSDDGVKITHTIHSSPMLWDPRTEKIFMRVDATFMLRSNLTGLGISLSTPDCSTPILTAEAEEGGFSVWDEAIWDTDVWPPESTETHIAMGFSCRGRWVQIKLQHDTLDEQFSFIGWSVLGHIVGNNPHVK